MTYHDIFILILFYNCLYKLYAEESFTHVKRNACAEMPKRANATKLPGRSSVLDGPLQAAAIAYHASNQSVVFGITREYVCRQKGSYLVRKLHDVCLLH